MIETAQAFGVDIGGSGIKAAPVNLEKGEFAEPRLKILTPEVSTPEAVAAIVRQQLEHFEVPETAPVGIAFPAPIKPGRPLDFMANLDQSWIGVDVTAVFSEACGRPVVRGQRRRRGRSGGTAVRRRAGPERPGHRHHAGHRHRHRADLQRRADPEQRARPHRTAEGQGRRREVRRLLGARARGSSATRSGRSA